MAKEPFRLSVWIDEVSVLFIYDSGYLECR